jgi:hypothetical protein
MSGRQRVVGPARAEGAAKPRPYLRPPYGGQAVDEGSSALPGVDGEIGFRPWGSGAIIGLYTLNKKHTLLGTVLSCMNYATLGPVLSLILITVVALIETAPLLGAHRRTRVRQRIRRLVLRCTSSVNEARRETRHWHEAEEGVRVEKAGYSFCGGILLSSG